MDICHSLNASGLAAGAAERAIESIQARHFASTGPAVALLPPAAGMPAQQLHCNAGSPSQARGRISLMLAAPLRARLTHSFLLQGAADLTPDPTRVGRNPVQPACRKRVRAERVPDPQGLESPTAAGKRARTERAAEPRGFQNPPTASKRRAHAEASGDSPDGLSSPIAGVKGRPRMGPRLRRGGPKATGGRRARCACALMQISRPGV